MSLLEKICIRNSRGLVADKKMAGEGHADECGAIYSEGNLNKHLN